MIVGLIDLEKFQNLFELIKSDNIKFITSFEGRSSQTIENIEKTGIDVADSFKQVAVESDILISANSPSSALDVSRKYGKYCRGIYLDLNNISPETTFEIAEHVENLVDGAIIGKIDSDNPILYLSGENLMNYYF